MHFLLIYCNQNALDYNDHVDTSKFISPQMGNLIPIVIYEHDSAVNDHAFVPAPFPPKWTFDTALWPLLTEAHRCIGELNGAARNLPNPQLFLKPLQRVESLTSSRLEGTFATAQELMLFELNPKESKHPGEQENSWLEVANYNRALAQACDLLNELPLCLRLIKDIHKTLLTGVRGHSKNPGEFRKHQVHIGSNRRFIPPPPLEIEPCLHALENYIQQEDPNFDPLVRCLMAHYQIETIHPFSDGNGRIGRVVLSLMIYKECKLTLPWLYLSPFFDRYKDEYINNLFKVSTEGAWSQWIEFCLRGVIDQAKRATAMCEKLRCLKKDMHSRTEGDGTARIHSIIEQLFDSPIVTIADLARRNNVHYHTAKRDVEYLAGKNILRPLPNLPTKTFYSNEVFRIAYVESQDEEL